MPLDHFDHAMATVNGIRMHYVAHGHGPAVLLLHGWPQTWFMWRHLIDALAQHHTVIAPDLRGYGLTDKPTTGYDKQTMAADVRALAHHLGHEQVTLIGHDRGARIAHRYALDHPVEVDRLAVLDVIPTRAMFRQLDQRLALGYWHWLFHMQPDVPELLVGDRIETYLRYLFARWTYRRDMLDDAIDTYVAAFSQPGALRAGFDDYRATLADLDADDASYDAGERVTAPLLALWGDAGLTGQLPVLDIWRDYAADVRGEGLAECGHFVPEERPEAVRTTIEQFLSATDA